jgi:hypothetical protein
MQTLKIFAGAAALVCLALVPAYPAQRGNSGKPKAVAPTSPTTKAPSAKSTPKPVKVETKVAKVDHVKPVKAETKVAKADHVKPVKAAKADATSVKTKKTGTTTTASTSTTTGTTSTSTATTTPTTIDFTSSSVGQKLSKNTNLSSKLATRLTALKYEGTVYQAAYGFKNLGQFVAATNVARNLGISFEQLKLNMTGLKVQPNGTVLQANVTPSTGTASTTGTITMMDPALVTNPMPTKSLGQSIQTVKSGVDSTAAAQTATTQANAEIQSTSTTTATPAPTTSSPTSSTTTTKKSTKKAS